MFHREIVPFDAICSHTRNRKTGAILPRPTLCHVYHRQGSKKVGGAGEWEEEEEIDSTQTAYSPQEWISDGIPVDLEAVDDADICRCIDNSLSRFCQGLL